MFIIPSRELLSLFYNIWKKIKLPKTSHQALSSQHKYSYKYDETDMEFKLSHGPASQIAKQVKVLATLRTGESQFGPQNLHKSGEKQHYKIGPSPPYMVARIYPSPLLMHKIKNIIKVQRLSQKIQILSHSKAVIKVVLMCQSAKNDEQTDLSRGSGTEKGGAQDDWEDTEGQQ